MRSVDVVSEIVIRRPTNVVASYVTDPANTPRWYANIRSALWCTEPPVAVGSRFAFVANFLGRRLEYTYTVTGCEPGFQLTMSTAEVPFPMTTQYTWAAVDNGSTKMTLRNHGLPKGFSGVLAPMMEVAMRRANRKDLENLKLILEAE